MQSMSQDHFEQPLISPDAWHLDSELIFLNHGSFGACPQAILEAQQLVLRELERSPVQFYLQRLPEFLSNSRSRVAEFVGASEAGLVFVSNASEGVMTALGAVDWQSGDEIIISQDSYPACRHMITELALRYQLKIRVAVTPFTTDSMNWSSAICDAFRAEVSERTRLILIDHITSPTALIYPVVELVALAKEIGALSLVDGAHAPAQLDLQLDLLDADFYTGNLHKWAFTPKSCAFLYVAESWRDRVRPRVISHGYLAPLEQRFHAMFDWVGTRDYSAFCVLPQAFDWVETQGGFKHLQSRNHQLALKARTTICEYLWPQGVHLPPQNALAHMAAIPLPDALANFKILSSGCSFTPQSSAAAELLHPVQYALNERFIEVPIITTAHGVMVRVSAQAYNYLDQYRYLAKTLMELAH